MAERVEAELNFQVGRRRVQVRAYDAVGVDDVYENAIAGVLYRFAVGEDLVQPTPREIKDWIIRLNLMI